MTSLAASTEERIFCDIDYIFEEIRNTAFNLNECIEQVGKFLKQTTAHTKAYNFYFTLWSTLVAQQRLMDEMRSYQKQAARDNIRLQTLEKLLLLVLKRDANLKHEEITHKILDALAERKKP